MKAIQKLLALKLHWECDDVQRSIHILSAGPILHIWSSAPVYIAQFLMARKGEGRCKGDDDVKLYCFND